jgi:hypothetical protein
MRQLNLKIINQSQVIFLSKEVKATATPCNILKGLFICKLYTSGPTLPKITKSLSYLS